MGHLIARQSYMTEYFIRRVSLCDDAVWVHCRCGRRITKRGTAGSFTTDGRHVVFADKFGDVLIGDCAEAVALAAAGRVPPPISGGPAQMPKKVSDAAAAAAAQGLYAENFKEMHYRGVKGR